jgi:glutathionylspermidine synthase
VVYEFTAAEVDELEAATEELHARCLDAVEYISGDANIMRGIGIPDHYHAYIRRSWERRDPSLYGRFDLAYDGLSPPKMMEYNADTPTMVIETALAQWFWLQDTMEGADQFNSVRSARGSHMARRCISQGIVNLRKRNRPASICRISRCKLASILISSN